METKELNNLLQFIDKKRKNIENNLFIKAKELEKYKPNNDSEKKIISYLNDVINDISQKKYPNLDEFFNKINELNANANDNIK